jgi:hypothetical protein
MRFHDRSATARCFGCRRGVETRESLCDSERLENLNDVSLLLRVRNGTGPTLALPLV